MKTQLVSTSAITEPLSLDVIKDHLYIAQGETQYDEILKIYRTAARERIENETNRKLVPVTYKLYLDDWPSTDSIEVPYAPLRSVPSTGVVYTDSDASSTTFSSTSWGSDTVSEPGRVVLKYSQDWPTATLDNNNPIAVEFNCGYANSSDIPDSLKNAMLLTIGHLYENRESVIVGQGIAVFQLPETVEMLIASNRMFTF